MRQAFWMIAVGCGMLLAAPAAHAALAISPTRIVLQGKPNARLTGAFTLLNNGQEILRVNVEPEDWAGGVSGERQPVEWVTFRPTTLELKPGQRAKVNFTVRVPRQASGELRTQVFFSSDVSGTAMPVRSRFGAILYVVVDGTEELGASIRDVKATYTASTPGVHRPDRLDVLVKLRNHSNTHIVPSGDIELKDAQDVLVATIPLQSGWALLPREEDAYHAIGHGVYLSPGLYTMTVTIRYGADVGQPTTFTETMPARTHPDGSVEILGSP